MPHLSADSLAGDREGLAFLHDVLHAAGEPAKIKRPPLLDQIAARKSSAPCGSGEPASAASARRDFCNGEDGVGLTALEALA